MRFCNRDFSAKAPLLGMNYYTWGTQSPVHQKIDPLKNKSNEQDSEIRALRGQVDRLTLACQSMWELIRDTGNFSEDELKSKIAEVDLRDGALDGKLGSAVIECKSCKRNTNSRRECCVWCGAEVERAHVFEG
ncbi:hypothetical protein OAK43_01720 [Verrucomicrobiales bacterium]|nr:hypothetical protein [Verrucomicrobiales bacterium]